jgi:hypothetical protein
MLLPPTNELKLFDWCKSVLLETLWQQPELHNISVNWWTKLFISSPHLTFLYLSCHCVWCVDPARNDMHPARHTSTPPHKKKVKHMLPFQRLFIMVPHHFEEEKLATGQQLSKLRSASIASWWTKVGNGVSVSALDMYCYDAIWLTFSIHYDLQVWKRCQGCLLLPTKAFFV